MTGSMLKITASAIDLNHPQRYELVKFTMLVVTTRMTNIDIVKLICKELRQARKHLSHHVADRKGHDMRYAIDPTKIHNELRMAYLKQNLLMVSRRQFSGILTTRNGGRQSFPANIRTTMRKCMATAN